MAEKRARESKLEKFIEFAELEMEKNISIERELAELKKKESKLKDREDEIKKNLESLKKHTTDSYAKKWAGEKPVAPPDASPVLEPAVFLWIGLGILLIVAPIILFIIGVNMQSQSVDSDPMGIYAIVFILIVLAIIFVKRCFENAGDLLEDYKKDVAIHNEYPTKKYQYDAALKKWNSDYTKYKNIHLTSIAGHEKELGEISAQLLEVRNAMDEAYKTLDGSFFENGCEYTDNEEKCEIQRRFKEIKDILVKTWSKHYGSTYFLEKCGSYSEYGALFSLWAKSKKSLFFCKPLVELMKKNLAKSKRGTVVGCLNKIMDGLYVLRQEWMDKIEKSIQRDREEARKWERLWKRNGRRF